MFSVQGLIIMFMFGILMYVLVEGLVEMYREWRAEKDEQFERTKLINSQLARANSDIDRLKTVRLNTILACLNNGISVKEISDALELSRQSIQNNRK